MTAADDVAGAQADGDVPSAPGQGRATDQAIEARQPRSRRSWWATLAVVLVAVVAAASTVYVVTRSSSPTGERHVFDIPLGTEDRISQGEPVDIVPAELHLHPADTMVVNNHDDTVHNIGLFTIRPGETVSYVFPHAGVFRGACTVHPSGSLTIYVE